ncbi:MAG: arabinogalactan endo-1,4-beta-galactosidase [Prevotella sp.]|nr:arabinogalactan endo-1,4-beta-galactosidase [Prevotella sp.]
MKRIILLAVLMAGLHTANAQKYVGGDISLLPSYEENGTKYLDKNGKSISDVITFSADNGLNAMRVRLFVEPANASPTDKGQGVRQDLDYVKALGKRIKDAGLAFLLDFHYSDSWADPVKQWTPKAWVGLSDDQLAQKIYDYTKDCLQQLVAAGATPDFIQTGNEISYGMLWGSQGSKDNRCYSGSDDNWPRFTNLLKQAGKACREVCPDAKIILHTERLAKPSILTNFYNKMKSASVDYDIIGTSYYSYYHGALSTLDSGLTTLESSFPDKKIMVVEAGYFYNWQPNISAPGVDLSATYPISEAGQQKFTKALIETLQKHENVTGLFWWWMEANEYGRTGSSQVTTDWYNAALWNDQTGKVTPAFYELQTFLGDDAHASSPNVDENAKNEWYTIDGKRVATPNHKGVYIRDRQKVVVK